MAIFYKEGETKIRPGIYQRYENIGWDDLAKARDGLCAIPVRASWGPLGQVVKNKRASELTKNYGTGTYGTGYTIPAAEAMFKGGAITVYTYRMGTGGAKASLEIAVDEKGFGLFALGKYVGTLPISIAIQNSLIEANKKQILVYTGTTLVETISFVADGVKEGEKLAKAVAKRSKYIEVVGDIDVVPIIPVASGALTGGADPTVTYEDYSKAFTAFEPYFYNTIAIDIDDDEDMTLSLMLKEYLDAAYEMGKLGIAVVGQKSTEPFEFRLENCKMFDDYKVVFLGSGYMEGTESKDGVMAICYTAGLIAVTPSNKGITRYIIKEATDLCETLSYTQYEDAILGGMLMLSMSHDGEIWYDSGINTWTGEPDQIDDEGWRKIRRTKVRFEMFDRLDRTLNPKVGRISADSDGVADVVQSGQRVLDAMADDEGKLFKGPKFVEDPDRPFMADSAWFIIQADDIDSLEKIYLRYQFRYTQNS